MRRTLVALVAVAGACSATSSEPWIDLFDGESLTGFAPSEFGGDEVVADNHDVATEEAQPSESVSWNADSATELSQETSVAEDEVEYCPRCGGLMRVQSRQQGLTRYQLVCAECRYHA